MTHRKPRGPFVHRRTVRLITEPGMDVDALKIIQSLPDFTEEICGVVPRYRGHAFDITLRSAEHASCLAQTGFDYDNIRVSGIP